MFHSILLEVSQKTTDVVKWVSLGAVFALLAVIAVICLNPKKRTYDAKHIAAAGLTLGLSFALSYAKFSPVMYGGSITIASFVPVLIYAYVYGVGDGLLAGLIFGLLNFISGPYILTPFTFILDYLLAFASIGLMGIAKKFTKKQTFNVVLGTIGVYAIRFLFHLISGFIYFAEDSIWVSLPDWALSNAFVYSFIYQCIYIPADCAIATVVMYVLAKTKVLDKMIAIIQPRRKKKKSVTAEITAEEAVPAEIATTDETVTANPAESVPEPASEKTATNEQKTEE